MFDSDDLWAVLGGKFLIYLPLTVQITVSIMGDVLELMIDY